MALTFGRSSSSSSQTTSFDTTLVNNDSRLVEGEEVNVGGNVSVNLTPIGTQDTDSGGPSVGGSSGGGDTNVTDISIVTTDFGALDTGRDIAELGLDAAGFLASQATEQLDVLSQQAREQVDSASSLATATTTQALKVASEATRDEQARTIQFLIIGAAVVAGLIALAGIVRARKGA